MAAIDINELLRYVHDYSGSDLHMVAGLTPRIRRHGSLEALGEMDEVKHEELMQVMQKMCSEAAWDRYLKTNDLDFAYALKGIGRFRVNFFRQENGAGLVARLIPEEIVPLEKLNIPTALEKFAHMQDGLVLVTGPTGSGKSTTLAAIVDKINTHYSKHIVTIEDPVEFIHKNKNSVISHREVGTDVPDFASGVRMATRQDADVLLLGELRDYETIARALDAAEMGMLVLSTVHTNNVASTIDRVIDVFPGEQQPLARTILSGSLVGVVSQILVPRTDGRGRCAALEIMFKTPALPSIIRDGNTPMIDSLIQSGKSQGMQLMDDALFALVRDGLVAPRTGFLAAKDKARFEKLHPAVTTGATATAQLR